MDSALYVFILFILILISKSFSQSVIQIRPENHNSIAADLISAGRKVLRDDNLYCESWRFSVETNDAGKWIQVPAKCADYVGKYMTGDAYRSDSEFVADDSLAFAKTVKIAGDGKDAWVFDIDETLLCNVPYYAQHGFGSEVFDETTFDEWVDLAEAPALPASFRLYKELKQLGFTIFLLTGRDESERNATVKNLQNAGYSNWEKLILRGTSNVGEPAIVYKSEKRKDLEGEGYRIHGSSGDQWSDLLGFAVATRSFKLPNPMYYIA
ncbi:acid phosphatase 1-like [Cornus florida]|uniref:acid phosphatase 1-like n=1 Tax=Cornus florida TaxID=4283 RepID=UPI0028985A7B|nr:acid phosphatase 1-like [Cornus florida]